MALFPNVYGCVEKGTMNLQKPLNTENTYTALLHVNAAECVVACQLLNQIPKQIFQSKRYFN